MSPVAPPRVLAIMGSGETAPTMAKVHDTEDGTTWEAQGG